MKRLTLTTSFNPLGTESTALLVTLWAQSTQSTPRKAVDLGYLFPDSVFTSFIQTYNIKSKDEEKHRSRQHLWHSDSLWSFFKGKSCTLIHRHLGLWGLRLESTPFLGILSNEHIKCIKESCWLKALSVIQTPYKILTNQAKPKCFSRLHFQHLGGFAWCRREVVSHLDSTCHLVHVWQWPFDLWVCPAPSWPCVY